MTAWYVQVRLSRTTSNPSFPSSYRYRRSQCEELSTFTPAQVLEDAIGEGAQRVVAQIKDC